MAIPPGPEWQELAAYLGERFNPRWTVQPERLLAEEFRSRNCSEEEFYRSTEGYLYDLTAFAESGTKEPYRALIRYLLPPGATLLDYGCGIGSDGLRFLAEGYRVAFADFNNPSTRYLRWRLKRRGIDSPLYDVEQLPAGLRFDLVYSFDVLEHVKEPLELMRRLEGLGRFVAVNLISEDPAAPYPLHFAHDWRPLLDHVFAHHTPIAVLDPYPNSKLLLYAVGKVQVPPLLSVVIPTHDRASTLAKTLDGLAKQSLPQAAFEVVVAPDRCDRETEALLQRPPLPVRVATVEGTGPAAARNAALELAAAPLVLFLDDDVEPTPGLLAEHLLFHLRNPAPPFAGLGRLRWAEPVVSPFMRTIESGEGLFAWPQIEALSRAGRPLPFSFFYTCNLSLKRELLEGERFDERFPAALEDGELGFRLAKRRGLELRFLLQAVGLHRSHKEFLPFLQRQRLAGEAAVLCAEKHPELAGQLRVGEDQPLEELQSQLEAAKAAVAALEPLAPPLPEEPVLSHRELLLLAALRSLYSYALELAYQEGVTRARQGRVERAAALHRAALAAHAAGDLSGAAEALETAARLDPGAELLNDLAVVLAELGQLDRAISLLKAANRADPNHQGVAENIRALTALAASLHTPAR